jgi:DNA helicase II / ATP-dependent DNA helicase PcrA
MTDFSPEQIEAIEATKRGESTSSKSVAGSGKTTLLVAQAQTSSEPSAAMAFGTRNKLDLKERMPPNVTVNSFNGFGHGAWSNHISKRLTVMDEWGGKAKTYSIMNELGLDKDTCPDFARFISICKMNLLIPHKAIGGLKASLDEDFLSIIDEQDLDMGQLKDSEILELAHGTLAKTIELGWKGTIDFDDQIYLPLIYRSSFRKYDRLRVDEAQDLNAAQHLMVQRMSNEGAQHTLAGDPRQAIFAFRGALGSSYDILANLLRCNDYPLTVSFRCPKAVVKEAQKIVPYMKAFEKNPEGLVREAQVIDPRFGDVILCRNNRPLIPIFYDLLGKGFPVKILGSDIGKGMATILKNLHKSSGDVPKDKALGLVREWGQSQYNKAMSKNQPTKAEMKLQQAQAMGFVLERAGGFRQAISQILDMFSDKIAPVTLSTIHKAKGLEWKRVWFLDPHLIPHKFATSEVQRTQEDNLLYVGITRAMQELVYVTSDSHFSGAQ